MVAKAARYKFERVHGGPPELSALQDRLGPLLERISGDTESAASSTEEAGTADGTSYTPAVAADWTGTAPTTVQEALDRIAAALGPIA